MTELGGVQPEKQSYPDWSNPNIPGAMGVTVGFLFLLLLPLDNWMESLGLGDFQAAQGGDIVKNCLIVVYGVILIRQFGYQKISGMLTLSVRNIGLLLIPTYFIGLGLLQYVVFDYEMLPISFNNFMLLLLAMITVGFSEEIIFRGFVLPHLLKGSGKKESALPAIVLSALLFGLLHFLNLLQRDSNWLTVLAQVIYATMFGVSFGITLLRTGSLFPLGILHGLINFSSNLAKLPEVTEPAMLQQYKLHDAAFSVIVVLPYFLYALQQLPKLNLMDVRAQFEK